MLKSHIKFIGLFLLLAFLTNCKKSITVDAPRTVIISAKVFDNDATAISALTGIYGRIMSNSGFANGGTGSITFLSGLSSDELLNYSTSIGWMEFYQNSITTSNFLNESLWTSAYQYIYSANAVIEGLNNSTGVGSAVKQQLLGEAKFIRAFCHFNLINLYGDVPFVSSTDYKENSTINRTLRADVYQKIRQDLTDAQNLLSDNYVAGDNTSTTERIRPNKSAATALLARVYLYNGDWINAESQAGTIIANTAKYSLESDPNNVFKKNSLEAIWQLMPVQPGFNTNEGNVFILNSINPFPSYATLTNQVLNAFEAGDTRKSKWVGSYTSGSQTFYFPYKYKVNTSTSSTLTEYSMVLRLAEQYLIRAEARAQQNKITEAQADLNVIRTRAGLLNTTAADKTSLLSAIARERQVELFTEWGHRWFDLKRTSKVDQVLSPIKGSTWQLTDTLYPIPQIQIQNSPGFPQNPGY